MQGFKGAILVTAIIATVALSACRREEVIEPMKLGAAQVAPVTQQVVE